MRKRCGHFGGLTTSVDSLNLSPVYPAYVTKTSEVSKNTGEALPIAHCGISVGRNEVKQKFCMNITNFFLQQLKVLDCKAVSQKTC